MNWIYILIFLVVAVVIYCFGRNRIKQEIHTIIDDIIHEEQTNLNCENIHFKQLALDTKYSPEDKNKHLIKITIDIDKTTEKIATLKYIKNEIFQSI